MEPCIPYAQAANGVSTASSSLILITEAVVRGMTVHIPPPAATN